MTKGGEKYHLDQGRNTFKGYTSYGKTPCNFCKDRTKQILVFRVSQPTPQSETELAFVRDNDEYHHEGCLHWRNHRRFKGTRPVRKVCKDEERLMIYARNRSSTKGQSRND